MSDERRRPRRDAPAADQKNNKNAETSPAPPCLGEALRRGTIINSYDIPDTTKYVLYPNHEESEETVSLSISDKRGRFRRDITAADQ